MAEISEAEFAEMLQELLESRELTDADGNDYSAGVVTFEDVMMLTMNKGLVVDVGDSQFQLTIVKSA